MKAPCRCDPVGAAYEARRLGRPVALPRPQVRALVFRINGREVRRQLVLVCPRCRSWWEAS